MTTTNTGEDLTELDQLVEQARQAAENAQRRSIGIFLVLDRSGSMKPKRTDVVDGYNHFIADQRSVPGDAWVSLTTFADDVYTEFTGLPIDQVPALTPNTYRPNGGTALWDAIGVTVDKAQKWLDAQTVRPEKILVQIITDGGENSSTDFNDEQISKLYAKLSESNWTFGFIGADAALLENATKIGVPKAYLAHTANTGSGLRSAFSRASTATMAYSGRTAAQDSELLLAGASFYGGDEISENESRSWDNVTARGGSKTKTTK